MKDDDDYELRTRLRASIDAITVPSRPLGSARRRSATIRRAAMGFGVLLTSAAAVTLVLGALNGRATNVEPAATGAPSAAPMAFHSSLASLTVNVPSGWTAREDGQSLDRVTSRMLFLSNGPIDAMLVETSANTRGNWSQVPSTTILVELREQVGGPAPQVPVASVEQASDATAWPVAPSGSDAGFDVYAVRVAYLWRTFEVRAHVGSSASPADKDALAALVRSMTFDTPPDQGSFGGGRAFSVGLETGFAIGSVTHVDARSGDPSQSFYLVRGSRHFFAIADRAYVGFAGKTPCPVRWDGADHTFVCDATGDRWDVYGVLRGDTHQYDLGWLGIVLRDSRVVVGGALVAGPRQIDEAAENAR